MQKTICIKRSAALSYYSFAADIKISMSSACRPNIIILVEESASFHREEVKGAPPSLNREILLQFGVRSNADNHGLKIPFNNIFSSGELGSQSAHVCPLSPAESFRLAVSSRANFVYCSTQKTIIEGKELELSLFGQNY